MQVSVTDPGVFDVDENIVIPQLRNRNLLVLEGSLVRLEYHS